MADEPTPITFESKEAFVKAVSEILDPKVQQIAALEARVKELTEQRQGQGGTPTAEPTPAAGTDDDPRIQTLTAQMEALNGKLEEQAAATDAATARWHSAVRATYIRNQARAAGAAETALSDIPSIFPADMVTVTEVNGEPQARFVDPAAQGLPFPDQGAAMAAFLETKPHLKGPPPGGAGQAGGGAGGANAKNFDDLTPKQQIKEGLAEYFG